MDFIFVPNLKMGNMEKSQYSTYKVTESKYKWISLCSKPSHDIVYDQTSGIEGERYRCCLNDKIKDMQIYQFRHQQSKYLPKVLFIGNLPLNKFVCFNDCTIQVIVERVPYRLSDFQQIGYSQGLYILEKCLQGGWLLWLKAGSIKFTDSMICFTKSGEAKIWLNQKLGENCPDFQICESERYMVNGLMQIIEQKMKESPLCEEFLYEKRQQKIEDFYSALKFVSKMKKKFGTCVTSIILPSMINSTVYQSNLKDIEKYYSLNTSIIRNLDKKDQETKHSLDSPVFLQKNYQGEKQKLFTESIQKNGEDIRLQSSISQETIFSPRYKSFNNSQNQQSLSSLDFRRTQYASKNNKNKSVQKYFSRIQNKQASPRMNKLKIQKRTQNERKKYQKREIPPVQPQFGRSLKMNRNISLTDRVNMILQRPLLADSMKNHIGKSNRFEEQSSIYSYKNLS